MIGAPSEDAEMATPEDAEAAGRVPPAGATEYVEWALEKAGGAGPFQYKILVALGLCWSYGAILCYMGLFAGMAAETRLATCKGEGCPQLTTVDCSMPHNSWGYADEQRTYLATFDLVCERATLAPMLPTLFFLGALLGVFVWGGLADKYGRKRALLGALFLQQLGVLGQALAPSYPEYACGRFLMGFGNAGFGLVSYLWSAEVLGVGLRSIMAWSPNVFFSLGQAFLSLLSFWVPEWRNLTHVIFMIGCFFALLAYLHESPKWLATQGRLSEAHYVLCVCAAINGHPSPPPPWDLGSKTSTVRAAGGSSSTSTPGARQLLDHRLRTRFLIICFAWFSTNMGYFGLSMNAASLPLDIYWANVVSGLSCIPAYLISGMLMEWPLCGRRGTVAGGFAVAGACLLMSANQGQVLLIVLYYLATSAVSLAFAVIYVWSSELFPTDIRGTSMGLQSLIGRVGAMSAPFVAQLGSKEHPTLPLLIFAGFCLSAGLLSLTLPETRGVTLPGTLEDMGKVNEKTAIKAK